MFRIPALLVVVVAPTARVFLGREMLGGDGLLRALSMKKEHPSIKTTSMKKA